VVALEPSADMAAVAKRNLAAYEHVAIEVTEFERWRPEKHDFRLVFSAQAWHWLAPAVRYVRAREVLRPGGALAAFWNIPDWEHAELRDELRAAYRRSGEGDGTGDPFHPSAQPGHDDWPGEIEAAPGFEAAEVRYYRWRSMYSTQQYVDLLGTQSANLVMEDAQRERLLSDVAGVIEAGGGTFGLPYVTQLCLARAS